MHLIFDGLCVLEQEQDLDRKRETGHLSTQWDGNNKQWSSK